MFKVALHFNWQFSDCGTGTLQGNFYGCFDLILWDRAGKY
jgi:hypothetical protein